MIIQNLVPRLFAVQIFCLVFMVFILSTKIMSKSDVLRAQTERVTQGYACFHALIYFPCNNERFFI